MLLNRSRTCDPSVGLAEEGEQLSPSLLWRLSGGKSCFTQMSVKLKGNDQFKNSQSKVKVIYKTLNGGAIYFW